MEPEPMILDLFAGPGGWSEGLRMIGLDDIGIEIEEYACRTRAAAGHRTIRADVVSLPTAPFAGKVSGLIASPPCQDWSLAGKRAGRDGDGGKLVEEVRRWVDDLRPWWIACEQVPPALHVWQEFAHLFRSWGYSAWAGILNAADYGVPQTRERAILLASRVSTVIPPEPTHAESPAPSLFGDALAPWVSMSEAFGWPGDVLLEYQRGAGMIERHGERPGRTGSDPCFTLRAGAYGETFNFRVRTGANSMKHSRRTEDIVPYERSIERPAPTVDGKAAHAWKVVGDGDAPPLKFTIREALIAQTFAPDYPVAGGKTKQSEQIGNAVPPLLAAHVVGALTGRTLREDVAA